MSGPAVTNGTGRSAYIGSESPFAAESLFTTEPAPTAPFAAPPGEGSLAATPFATEFGSGITAANIRAEQYASLVGELFDTEFENAVSDLVHEATTVAGQQLAWEGEEDPGHGRAMAERVLREHFAPLERESEAFLDRFAATAAETDLRAMSETELNEFLDRFEAPHTSLPPAMDQFLGKLVKKAKKAVAGAVKLAKKGVALAAKYTPIGMILDKLKALVKPLLERVLKFALDKLPVSLRPIATQLAKQLFGAKLPAEAEVVGSGYQVGTELEFEVGDDLEAELQEMELAAADPRAIQEEMDAALAGAMLGGEAFEQQAAMVTAAAADPVRDQAMPRLVRARRRFARRILAMREGEDPTPALEEFVPAILTAAKLGIGILGRPKVVKTLAGLVAPLIGRYVGTGPATQLSSALVDTGLRLMSLEMTHEDETAAAADTVTSTVEGTVNRLVATVPESEWENGDVLHGYVRGAFEDEAAATFPDPVIRAELHETAQLGGQWTEMPVRGARKLYRKYSRIAEARITPQVAAELESFGGLPLASVLRDQLGLPANAATRARVHLYEAKRGTRIGEIAAGEAEVPGLGHSRREARALIHPLTRKAAGLLLGEPKLGTDVSPALLADRDRIGVGQRLYALEIPGAQVRVPPSGRGRVSPTTGRTADHTPAHASQGAMVVDVPKREVRVALFYAERDAQMLAAGLRKRAPSAAVLGAMQKLFAVQMRTALARPGHSVRIIHEAVQTEASPADAMGRILRHVGRPLGKVLRGWIADAMQAELEARYDQFAQGFIAAADAADDGVTLAISFNAPSLIEGVRQVVSRKVPALATMGLFRSRKPSGFEMRVKAGYVRL